jgi:ADP-heptose:LPS heptosyltransferase
VNTLTRHVVGTLQKTRDFADYVWHRGLMLLRFHRERLRHRLALGSKCQTILVVRLGSIGDVVRSTAIVDALRRRYPRAAIDLLTSELTRPLVDGHPHLRAVYGLNDLARLGTYDWVINLQNAYPTTSFLSPGVMYPDVVEHLSSGLGAQIVSGRQKRGGQEISPTNVLYCRSEMEELFLIALLDFDPRRYPRTEVRLDPATQVAVQAKFRLPDRPRLGLFLGSNSVGCGADNGFRTYSMEYLERVVAHFSERFVVVMIGQSSVRTAEERTQYYDMLRAHPTVVDLVDKTTLQELACVMDQLEVVIACDSSPVHLAQARGIPVVALYVLEGAFRLGPRLEYDTIIGLNSAKPCFYYSWRWKYFCRVCRDPRTRAAYCDQNTFAFGVDRIAVHRIDDAVTRLLHSGRKIPLGNR